MSCVQAAVLVNLQIENEYIVYDTTWFLFGIVIIRGPFCDNILENPISLLFAF